jgi:hypothetical protein
VSFRKQTIQNESSSGANAVEDSTPKKRFSTKGFTSLLLACAFLVMGVSGAILYFTPRGRDAHWTDWSLFGLGKEDWGAIHINNSILFLLVALLHLVLNWRIFWSYVTKSTVRGLNLRKEMAAAGLVAVVFVTGTIYGLPPFSTVMDWNTAIKDYWGRRTAQAPVAHGEELTLVEFSLQIEISPEEAANALRQEGFDVDDATATMKEIAAMKGVAPSELLAAIRKHHPQVGNLQGRGGRGMGQGGGRGYGAGRSLEAASGPCDQSDAAEPCERNSAETEGTGEHAGLGLGQGGGPGRGMGMGLGMGMRRGQGGNE